ALPTPSGTRRGTRLVRSSREFPGVSGERSPCLGRLTYVRRPLPPGVPRVSLLRSAGFAGLLACTLSFAQPQSPRLPAPDGLTLAEAAASAQRRAGSAPPNCAAVRAVAEAPTDGHPVAPSLVDDAAAPPHATGPSATAARGMVSRAARGERTGKRGGGWGGPGRAPPPGGAGVGPPALL